MCVTKNMIKPRFKFGTSCVKDPGGQVGNIWPKPTTSIVARIELEPHEPNTLKAKSGAMRHLSWNASSLNHKLEASRTLQKVARDPRPSSTPSFALLCRRPVRFRVKPNAPIRLVKLLSCVF